MKAFVLYGIRDLRFEEVERCRPEGNEVLVEVRAVGICGSDIPRIYETGAHKQPLIPGHEFSGVVREVGPEGKRELIGKRVGVFPLIPCRKCIPCRNRQYEMCRNYSYLGSRRDGGFAEYVTVPAENLILLPENVSFEAAAMMEPMAVAVHALRRVAPAQDGTVAVIGLGTIGLLLTMFLREAGIARVLTVGNKDFQREQALKLGVSSEDYCDARKQEVVPWIMEHTGGDGVDVAFECVGKETTYAQAVDIAAPAGEVLLLGNPASDMTLEKSVYWKILRNQLRVSGTWNSSFDRDDEDDWHYVLRRLSLGVIHPEELITHRFPLEKLPEGLGIMREKSEDYVKVMIRI